MDRRDEQLPDELSEAAEWMRESRTETTPLRLDELKQRAQRQAARRQDAGILGGMAARWRVRVVTTFMVLGLMLTSLTGVVLATGGVGKPKSNVAQGPKDPATTQYLKPGCGPDKTDGVAGNSGRHSGQPPKDQNRGDCPNPPGQNK